MRRTALLPCLLLLAGVSAYAEWETLESENFMEGVIEYSAKLEAASHTSEAYGPQLLVECKSLHGKKARLVSYILWGERIQDHYGPSPRHRDDEKSGPQDGGAPLFAMYTDSDPLLGFNGPELTFRFDKEKIRKSNGFYRTRDWSVDATWRHTIPPNAKKFVRDVLRHRELRLDAKTISGGRAQALFNLEGAVEATAAVLRACKLEYNKKKRKIQRLKKKKG